MISEKVKIFPHRGLDVFELSDPAVGLNGFLAHTAIKPGMEPTAIGGIRNLSGQGKSRGYALELACDLAFAMEDKAWAIKGLRIGGAKTVLFGPGKKTSDFLKAVGVSLENFNLCLGTTDLPRYIYSVDVGTTVPDVMAMHQRLRCSSMDANPSPETAKGVVSAVLAFLRSDLFTWHYPTVPAVYITGVCGEVGSMVARLLIQAGVLVYGKDITTDRVRIAEIESIGVAMVSVTDFPRVDVYVPCAIGGILNSITIPQIYQAGIQAVIGSANCQLVDAEKDALLLHQMKIFYGVDWLGNRAGLICVAGQWKLLDNWEQARDETGEVMMSVFRLSRGRDVPTTVAAKEYFAHIPKAA